MEGAGEVSGVTYFVENVVIIGYVKCVVHDFYVFDAGGVNNTEIVGGYIVTPSMNIIIIHFWRLSM